MKKKLRLAIQEAIADSNITTLEKFSLGDIETFQFIPAGAQLSRRVLMRYCMQQ
jgi:hypothetical protein